MLGDSEKQTVLHVTETRGDRAWRVGDKRQSLLFHLDRPLFLVHTASHNI